MNLPNQLTLIRIVLTFVFIGFMSFENPWCWAAGLIVFIVASVTDYFDGKIARERNLITNFGKLLDPAADKILVAAAFIMLMLLDDLRIPGWTVVLIIGREFLVSGMRALAAIEGVVVAANRWGKTKTVLQIVYVYFCMGILLLLELARAYWPEAAEAAAPYVGPVTMWTAVALALYTAYSGYQLIRANWHHLRLDNL